MKRKINWMTVLKISLVVIVLGAMFITLVEMGAFQKLPDPPQIVLKK